MPAVTTDDGVRLAYTEHGDPFGKPVVLIAGFKAPATSWRPQQKALAKAGYRVLSFDRRGHGLSDRPDEGATLLQHGADLRTFIHALGLTDVVLVGGSMGGNSIWAYVSEHGTVRLRAIVIVDQTPKMLNSDDWAYGFYDYDASNRDTLFATAVPNPKRHSIASKGPIRVARLLRALRGGDGGKALTPTELELLGDHATADWRSVIGRVRIPVLFIAGRESDFWPAEHAAAAAALTPKGTAVVIEKDGHAANIEQPARFNEVLLAYLAAL